jgi:hypothetical protein
MSQWHCMVNGRQYGPVDEQTLASWISQGRCGLEDFAWTPGQGDWRPLREIPVFVSQLSSVPPPLAPHRETAPGAIASLICGIVGLMFGCAGLIMGIIAVHQARKGLNLIRQNPGCYDGEGLCTAGRVMGIIAMVVGGLSLVWMAVWLMFIAGMGFMEM